MGAAGATAPDLHPEASDCAPYGLAFLLHGPFDPVLESAAPSSPATRAKSGRTAQAFATQVLGTSPPLTEVSRALRARNAEKVSSRKCGGGPGRPPKTLFSKRCFSEWSAQRVRNRGARHKLLDDRQITHLISVRLKHLLYDFFRLWPSM